jgi:hypothetical protein
MDFHSSVRIKQEAIHCQKGSLCLKACGKPFALCSLSFDKKGGETE